MTLPNFALGAHGGLSRRPGVSALTAKLPVGGPSCKSRGLPGAFGDQTADIGTRRRHAVPTPGRRAERGGKSNTARYSSGKEHRVMSSILIAGEAS